MSSSLPQKVKLPPTFLFSFLLVYVPLPVEALINQIANKNRPFPPGACLFSSGTSARFASVPTWEALEPRPIFIQDLPNIIQLLCLGLVVNVCEGEEQALSTLILRPY